MTVDLRSRGPCAKRRVTCTIACGAYSVFVGENDCANPQPACPRLPGEGYEKCKTICQQAGHAEVEAIRKVHAAGFSTVGRVAQLRGHYWMCEPCGRALAEAGISEVEIFPSL